MNVTHSRRRPWVATLLGLALTLAFAGCGGGGSGGSGSSTSTGTFKDGNVAGLSYVSGDESGTTNALGQFTYENNAAVTFRIGGVTLGTTAGAEIVTPVDIAETTNDLAGAEVANIVRFLLMLDEDADADNGVQIPQTVRDIADGWVQPDFAGAGFDTEVESIVTEVGAAYGRTVSLPTPTEARDHLERTLRCITAGGFRGTYSGDDRGTFGFLVDAQTGEVVGFGYSTLFDEFFEFFGSQAVSLDTGRTFTSGVVATGGTFSGEFPTPNSIVGTWNENGDSGTFRGSRIGGDPDARFRFTGEFEGDDFGLFTFDVDEAGNVTGVAYSVIFDELESFSGSISGTNLTVATATGSATGTLDTATGSLFGNWSSVDEDGVFSGTFSGNGCRLN